MNKYVTISTLMMSLLINCEAKAADLTGHHGAENTGSAHVRAAANSDVQGKVLLKNLVEKKEKEIVQLQSDVAELRKTLSSPKYYSNRAFWMLGAASAAVGTTVLAREAGSILFAPLSSQRGTVMNRLFYISPNLFKNVGLGTVAVAAGEGTMYFTDEQKKTWEKLLTEAEDRLKSDTEQLEIIKSQLLH